MLGEPLGREPVYHNEVVKRLYARDEVWAYWFFGSWWGRIAKLYWTWEFFLGPALTLPFLALTLALPFGFSWKQISEGTRFLLLTMGVMLIAMECGTFHNPHYIGPATSLMLALVLLAIRSTSRC